MGAQLVREVANKTSDLTGDGTTTATLLAQAIIREGMSALEDGANPMLLRRGIEEATELVVAELGRGARQVTGEADLTHVATIAAKEDERIGSAVARALDRVGPEGVVTIEESERSRHRGRVRRGHARRQRPLLALPDPGRRADGDGVREPVRAAHEQAHLPRPDLMPTLDAVMKEPRPLVIFAEKVEGPALGLIVQNNQHGTLKAVVVRAPGFGHRRIAHLQDLAAFTGGEVVTDEAGLTLDQVKPSTFGSARRVVISGDSTVLVEGAGSAERVAARLAQIRVELERATQDTDIEVLRERLAKLVQPARRDPRRRRHRPGAQGEVPAHRGGPRGDPCGGAARASSRAAARRCCAPSRCSTTPGLRATICAASRSSTTCSPNRSSGSRRTPATTAPP